MLSHYETVTIWIMGQLSAVEDYWGRYSAFFDYEYAASSHTMSGLIGNTEQ